MPAAPIEAANSPGLKSCGRHEPTTTQPRTMVEGGRQLRLPVHAGLRPGHRARQPGRLEPGPRPGAVPEERGQDLMAAQTVYCGSCGAPNPVGTAYCGRCGRPLAAPAAAPR